jgi:hypothetical protein
VSGANSPTSMNPFVMQSTYAPIPAPEPLPPVPQFNPFNSGPSINPTPMNQPSSNSIPPQPMPQTWNAMAPASPTVNGPLLNPPLQLPTISPGIQRVSSGPVSPGLPSPNPFMQQQQPSPFPTNPFFPISQTQPPSTPASPYQPQFSQPTQPYQPQFFNPQTAYQQPPPNPAVQAFASNQPNPNMVYGRPRLDKQSILNLYNAPSSDPTQQFIQAQKQNGVPAWNHQ